MQYRCPKCQSVKIMPVSQVPTALVPTYQKPGFWFPPFYFIDFGADQCWDGFGHGAGQTLQIATVVVFAFV